MADGGQMSPCVVKLQRGTTFIGLGFMRDGITWFNSLFVSQRPGRRPWDRHVRAAGSGPAVHCEQSKKSASKYFHSGCVPVVAQNEQVLESL